MLPVSAADTGVSVSGSGRLQSADAAVSLSDRAGTVVGKAAGSEVEEVNSDCSSRPSEQRQTARNCRPESRHGGTQRHW